MSITVTLDWFEIARAANVGIQRQVTNMAQGNHDGHLFGTRDPWGTHIAGALAECAFAKAIDKYWVALARDYKSLPGDVGMEQVRSTTRKNGSLLLHPDDPDLAKFWLVIDSCPHYEIAGWIYGRHGKQEEFWRTDTGRPAFFVPQSRLIAFDAVEVAA